MKSVEIMAEKKYIIDNEDLMMEWDWDKNNEMGLDPKKLVEGSHTKAHWKCNIHNKEYMQVIRDKVSGQLSCKKCESVLVKNNDKDGANWKSYFLFIGGKSW